MIYNYGFPVSPIQRQALQPAQAVPYAPIDYSQPAMTGTPLDLEVSTPNEAGMFSKMAQGYLKSLGKKEGGASLPAGGIMSQQIPPSPGLLQMPQAQPMAQPMAQPQKQMSPYMQNLMRMASGYYG